MSDVGLTFKDPDTLQFLSYYIKEASRIQLEKYLRDVKISLVEHKVEKQEYAFGDEMSIIMLWSGLGSMVFKVHFALPICLDWASHGLKRDKANISNSTARDFMKEYNNVMGGFIRGTFERYQILVGMSLPFLAPGDHEVVFNKIRDPRALCSSWKLSDGQHEVICSSEICLLEPDMVKQIRGDLEKYLVESAKVAEDAGEISFL